MKFLAAAVWRWSWLITVPAALFFLTWLLGFWSSYRDFQLRYDVSPHRFSWNYEGRSHAAQLWRRLQSRFVPLENPDLPIVNLFVSGDQLARLDADLPYSGFEYVRGKLLDGPEFLKVRTRYRGDFFYHWAYRKKSLRIKTKRTQRFRGLRTFNAIAPKFTGQVNDLLGYQLAEHLGLMTPQAEAVWLYCNGECRGLHLLIEQIGEGTLRDRDRMPGDIYSGELVAKDSWLGLDNHLFNHPGLWTKAAVNNHFPASARRPLERLCELVAMPPDEAVHRELGRLLDLPSLARLAALEILTGNYHTGETHNWRLYWDPWRTRFEPIVWDPSAYGGFEQLGPAPPVGLDPNVSRVHNLLLTNANFLLARQAALREFLSGDRRVAYARQVQQAVGVARFAADHDPLLLPADPELVRSVVDRLPAHIARIEAIVADAYLEDTRAVRWARLPTGDLRIEVADRVPVVGLELRFATPLPAGLEPRLSIARTGEQVVRRLLASRSDRGVRLHLDVALHAQLQPAPKIEMGVLKVLSHDVLPTTYDVLLDYDSHADGVDDGAGSSAGRGVQLLSVDVVRAGGAIEPAREVELLPRPHHDLLYGVGADEPVADVHWRGQVELVGTTTLDADLWIEAGTTVRLAPGASLLLRGRCIAVGTQEQPIRFQRREQGDSSAPWGVVALIGDGADGSSFRHVRFDGGSGLVDPGGMFEFSGMVSIHTAADVAFENCRFERGTIVDDMVHAVYAEVSFADCAFVECPGDAVDLDISRAVLRRCHFERVGNDGLDLMTSWIDAERCRFVQCGDKGVSVGEGSRLLALDCTFDRCAIGVQAKDGSQVALAGSRFERCGQALDAYLKNWRYAAGGSIVAWSCRMVGNLAAPAADKRSRIQIGGGFADPVLASGQRVVIHDSAPPPRLPWLLKLSASAEQRWVAAAGAVLPAGR